MIWATPSPTWRCGTCGNEHSGLATAFGPAAPDPWASASDEQRASGEVDGDLCVLPVDGTTHYFIRGEVQIPIVDADMDQFVWTVWSSLSEASMRTTADHWEDPDRSALPPMFGWLCNRLPYTPTTTSLALHVWTREPGVVPVFELDPGIDHPLVREQRDGITLHRVAELNRLSMGSRKRFGRRRP